MTSNQVGAEFLARLEMSRPMSVPGRRAAGCPVQRRPEAVHPSSSGDQVPSPPSRQLPLNPKERLVRGTGRRRTQDTGATHDLTCGQG